MTRPLNPSDDLRKRSGDSQEPLQFGGGQQVAVIQARPALILGCSNRVPRQMRPDTPGNVLIKQD
jgi:hypothetical protein